MSKDRIMNKATRTFHKVGFNIKKHSPEILIGAGVVGIVTSTVMACKATTKVSAILDETKEQVDGIHSVLETPALQEKYVAEYGTEYTKEDSKKDLAIVYTQTGLKFVKLYAPSIILGGLSIAAIITSHRILSKRNVALAAAYATVDKSFKTYRGRVVERFGEELDRELRYNIKSKEIEEVEVDAKGKEKKVKKTVGVVEGPLGSPYAAFFDDGCTGWTKNAEYNKTFLIGQQNYANELLQSRGHLFLNEVYDMLGIPRTEAGQLVGWIYDEECPNGDNYVDFGIFDNRTPNRNFVNGYERTILLDFNVDGPIYNLL